MTRGSIPSFDLYAELEVSRQATPAVIEAAHRALVKRHHPDVADSADGPADNERITRLNIARDWLLDPARRARYDGRPAIDAAAPPRATTRARRSGTTEAKQPARPSSAASFGVHSREVRQFLAELRELDGARTQRLVDARATVDPVAYTAARDASLEASREGRAAPWAFARDAAAVIVKNKVGDAAESALVASVAADIAGGIVVRDRITPAELERLREPWARSAAAFPIEAARRQRSIGVPGPAASGNGRATASRNGRATVASFTGLATLASPATFAALARRPRALGLVAAGLAVLLAIAVFAGGRRPESAVAGLTSGPSGGAFVPGESASWGSGGPFVPNGSTDPFATGSAGQTDPGSTALATPIPGRTNPPVAATPGPTPRATATPKPSTGATPTARPTSSLLPTPQPTSTPTSSPRNTCTVIDLVGTNSSNAQLAWNTAGFTGTVLFSPAPPPQYKIASQSLTAGTEVPCDSDISVQAAAP
ncbi:MAG TPA: DnaJ domain-containing protein [Candidatus Limnocylindrales bacterium]|nr:DnaJ domain-containing protein [Candidatus Limnocylindrales bacterium]